MPQTFYWDCLRKWYCSPFRSAGLPLPEGCAGDDALTNQTVRVMCEADARCECEAPWSYASDTALLSFWKVIYLSAQILTWCALQ